jgi:excisionase family DNA binding protein
MVERSRANWPVLIKDHHDGYITWADFLANEAKLAANRTNAGARPPREGCALAQGIIACGSCGKPMRTNYHTDQRPSYECSSRADRLTTPTCRSVAAATVDQAVAAALLNALTPEQVALALSAADQVTDRHQRLSRAAQLAVERARYDADRAERAFGQVEPENRLVARTLEARWETKLAALTQAEQALEAAHDALPPLPSRTDLEKLAADLPALWHAPTTGNKDRKRLLRTLIADVTLLPETDPDQVRIGVRWHTGATEQLTAARAVHPGTAKRSPTAAIDLVKRLGPSTGNEELVTRLNAAGLRTGHGRPFDIAAVQWIRHAHKIPTPDPFAAGEISVAEAARRVGCSTTVIYHWIHTEQLAARRGSGNRFCIPWNDQTHADCQTLIDQSAHLDRTARPRKLPAPPSPAADGEVSVTEAAYRLGCSIGVLYYWIETGQLAVRRGPGNRLNIPWDHQVEVACRTRIERSGHLNPAARRTKPRKRR